MPQAFSNTFGSTRDADAIYWAEALQVPARVETPVLGYENLD